MLGINHFTPKIRRKSTPATTGMAACVLRSRRWWSFETMMSALPSTAHSRILLSSGSATTTLRAVRGVIKAGAGDGGDASYDFLHALVLPSKIRAEHAGSLPNDGRRDEESVTAGPGRPPQNRIASLRVLERSNVEIGVEDSVKPFGAGRGTHGSRAGCRAL